MWLMIVVQTIGAIDLPGNHGPGSKTRKLPAPRTYVAVVVLWSIFGLLVDAGQRKAAVTMAWVTVLTGAVIGPFGAIATNFLKTVAQNFQSAPPASGASQGTILA